jgi:P27 family predicted phage terminase small subunit
MGFENSGRRPKPTALKILQGNPGKRRLNPNEPQPPVVDERFDAPPVELGGDPAASAEWTRLAPMLRTSRIVSEADRGALVALCQQWSAYLESHGKVRTLGMVVKGANGQPLVNPYFAVADKALKHCQKLWTELGLTPSCRSRIAALPQAETKVSKWAGML